MKLPIFSFTSVFAGAGSYEQRVGEYTLGFNANLSLWTVLINAMNLLITIGLLLSATFLAVGGIQFITSTGNKENATKATETIKWAVIGLVIILVLNLILNLINNWFLSTVTI